MKTLRLVRSLTGNNLEKVLASMYPRAFQTLTKAAAVKAMEQGHDVVALALPTGKDMDINGLAMRLGYIVAQESVS